MAIRRLGKRASDVRIEAVVDAYSAGISEEYNEQQEKIDAAYRLQRTICVGIDTSYSQSRNAKYSQTACLDHENGEIIRMVILNKENENCISNELEVRGVEKLINQSHGEKKYLFPLFLPMNAVS